MATHSPDTLLEQITRNWRIISQSSFVHIFQKATPLKTHSRLVQKPSWLKQRVKVFTSYVFSCFISISLDKIINTAVNLNLKIHQIYLLLRMH